MTLTSAVDGLARIQRPAHPRWWAPPWRRPVPPPPATTTGTAGLPRGAPSTRKSLPNKSLTTRTHAGRAARVHVAAAANAVDESSAKMAALEDTMKSINKQFGDGTIQWLGATQAQDIDRLSSGSLTLDLALGGGWPKGRIIEIYGPESSGKTTLAIHAIAEIQRQGGVAAFVDAEHAFNVQYAKKCGVDMAKLAFLQPECGEDALEAVDQVIS